MEEPVRPLLKWLGGKTQIIDKIISKFPKKINNYYEPFIGGGSILINLLQQKDIIIKGNIYVYDLNKSLIDFYKSIQSNPELFYIKIMKIINKYRKVDNKELFYYQMRNQYNKRNTPELFLFLNKTCFRGMFRESDKGFNVSYGHYDNPEIINYEHLIKFSKLIQKVNFINLPFTSSLVNIKNTDFVYLDPPYYPTKSISFVNYTVDSFKLDDHNALFNIILNMKNKFIMSNSNVKELKKIFKSYNITKILAKRCINSKNPESKVYELLIMNYYSK